MKHSPLIIEFSCLQLCLFHKHFFGSLFIIFPTFTCRTASNLFLGLLFILKPCIVSHFMISIVFRLLSPSHLSLSISLQSLTGYTFPFSYSYQWWSQDYIIFQATAHQWFLFSSLFTYGPWALLNSYKNNIYLSHTAPEI